MTDQQLSNPGSMASGAAAEGKPPTRLSRFSREELRSLYLDESIHLLGQRAWLATETLHPEDYRTYVVDRNINYANWCTARCTFCNFKADPPEMRSGRKDLPPGYTLTYEQIGHKVEELLAIGGTQVLMQGGLVPTEGEAGLPFEWYLDLLRFLKRNYPSIHLHAFSPPEIFAFHRLGGRTVREVLQRLQEAGLESVPGGGAEILSDRVRSKISVGKTNTAEWLEVMRQAHRLGMKTSCTMMFGHIETVDERIEHLLLLRDLQDEALASGYGGGFSAFICWPFQSGGTPLGRTPPLPLSVPGDELQENANGVSRSRSHARPLNDGQHLLLADAHEYLTMLALARLALDNIANLQSSWVTMGPQIGQLALFFGANDMGSVMMEENVVSSAGTSYTLNEDRIRHLIVDAGWRPQKRDYYYRPIA